MIYVLHTYVLNNSLDNETIEKIVKNLQLNLTESELRSLGESRVANLARSLKIVSGSRGMIQFKEFEEAVSKVYLEKYKMRIERAKARELQNAGQEDEDSQFESNPEEGH